MTPTTVPSALAMSGLVPFEAKLLLAHVLDRDRAWLAAHGDAPLTREQALAYDALGRRRRHGEPEAYLTARGRGATALAPLRREQALSAPALARRRRTGEPVAYLTGRREFFGLELEV